MGHFDKRIDIELNKIKNEGGTVTKLEPYHYILEKKVNNEIIKLDVDLRNQEDKTKVGYAFQAPLVYILSPFVLQVDFRSNWSPMIFMTNFFTLVEPMIQSMKIEPIPQEASRTLQEVIDVAKATEGPLWLVIGSHQGEDPRGRSMYENPQVFFLDRLAGDAKINRTFQVDMTDPRQMGILARELPKKFEKLCFDESVTKFFTPKNTIESQRDIYYVLKSFFTMLTKDGILFIAEPGSKFGGLITFVRDRNGKFKPNTYPHPGSIFPQFVESVGFHTKEMMIEEINDPLVKLVHKDAKGGGSKYFLVCQKSPFKGGRRRGMSHRRKVNPKSKSKRRRR